MQLFIKLDGKKTILLYPQSNEPIKHIKNILEYDLKIPQLFFHLIFEGKQLNENNTLDYYNINNESTIYIKVLHVFFNKGLDKTLRDILIYQKNETRTLSL